MVPLIIGAVGIVLSAVGADGFVAGQMIVQAIAEGGDDVNAMIGALEGWEFEGPKGTTSIRESDHALIQPMFTGDAVGLSTTITFVALLFWGWVLGPLGALLAIPATLLVLALFAVGLYPNLLLNLLK